MTSCITWRGVHRFEPRYDLGAMSSDALDGIKARGFDIEKLLSAYRTKTYVHDICIRCGKIVKRGGA